MSPRLLRMSLFITPFFVFACGGQTVTAPPPEPASAPVSPDLASDQAPDECSGADCPGTTKAPADTAPATESAPPQNDKPKESPPVSDVPGANISIGRLEADGLVTKDIECKSDGGGGLGLLGMVLVTAWMSPQKSALDACAPAGSNTRVVWKARGGKVLEIVAKGDGKACVERALRSGKPVFDGHCAATIEHGKK